MLKDGSREESDIEKTIPQEIPSLAFLAAISTITQTSVILADTPPSIEKIDRLQSNMTCICQQVVGSFIPSPGFDLF